MTKTLKVLSALLCYPQPEMYAALGEMATALEQEQLLPPRERQPVQGFIQRLMATELMELQQQYVATFDRGRALSLHLFEHIHGESRDRGQAMVNLLEVYRRHGFELDARELPDYLPLFLEYLAQRPAEEALALLAETAHVTTLLGARLAERRNDYHVLFDALTALVGEPADSADIRQQAATEGPDQTVVNMDQIWEEEAVTFLNSQDRCIGERPVSPSPSSQPVQWLSRSGALPPTARSL